MTKYLQKVPVSVPASASGAFLYLWTSFMQGTATSAHHCSCWGRITLPSQHELYFPLNNFLFRTSLPLSVGTGSGGAGLLFLVVLTWVTPQVCTMREKNKPYFLMENGTKMASGEFHQNWKGETGVSGPPAKENITSRWKPLLSFDISAFQ